MRAQSFAAAATLLGIVLAAPLARAQVTGFAVDRFDPAERGSEWFVTDSLDLRGHGRPAIGVIGDFAYRPLVLYNPDGSVGASIVRNQYVLHPGMSLVLWDRVRFGVSLPVAIYEDGHQETVRGVIYPGGSGSSVGDVRLGGDVRLAGEYGDVMTLAFGVELYLPSGNQAAYMSDGTVRLQPRLQAAGMAGAFTYAAKIAFDYRSLEYAFAGSQLGSDLMFAVSAGLRTTNGRFMLGPELYGSTVLTGGEGAFRTRNTPFELLLGGHAMLGPDWRIGAGVGPGLSRGLGSPEARVLASLEWAPGIPPVPLADRDHDGVPDFEDACPDVPGVRTTDPTTNGCPEAPRPPDRDGDGIADVSDACPDVPGPRTRDPKTNGCPADRDGDGVYDAVDACPDDPGLRTDDPSTSGCPDRDHDAVPDRSDACPDVPGVKTADPKTNGCPSDRDNDGIPDTLDACPDNAGPPNPDPAKNGCPMAVVQAGQIRIMEQVRFRFGKADLDPASDPILEAVRQVMAEHAGILQVRVEGHTDNKGGAAYNLNLSKARAHAVVAWLVTHGVEQGRLQSQGYGPARPIADNKTEDGRRENRRVEFHIVDDEKKEMDGK